MFEKYVRNSQELANLDIGTLQRIEEYYYHLLVKCEKGTIYLREKEIQDFKWAISEISSIVIAKEIKQEEYNILLIDIDPEILNDYGEDNLHLVDVDPRMLNANSLGLPFPVTQTWENFYGYR